MEGPLPVAEFTEPTEPVISDDELRQPVPPSPTEGTDGYPEAVQ